MDRDSNLELMTPNDCPKLVRLKVSLVGTRSIEWLGYRVPTARHSIKCLTGVVTGALFRLTSGTRGRRGCHHVKPLVKRVLYFFPFLPTFRLLFANFLPTFCQLFANFLPTFCQLFANFLPTFANFLVTLFCQLFANYLPTICQLVANFLPTFCQLSANFLPNFVAIFFPTICQLIANFLTTF